MLDQKLTDDFMKAYETYKHDFDRVKEAVANSKAIYKGAPVPYLYLPMLYFDQDIDTFKYALRGIHDISKRTIELYLEDESVRQLFNFDSRLDALIRVPHHYDTTVPMGRFDIFYYGEGSFQFCELNADGASAMNEEFELSKIMSQTELLNSVKDTYDFQAFELFHSWVAEVKSIYASYLKNTGKSSAFTQETTTDNTPHKGSPFVAILDFIDKGSPLEFEMFRDAFIDGGFECEIVDPRDLTEIDGKLYIKDRAIDIIYRRLVTKDLMDRYDEVPALINGLLAGKTCVIGSIKTQVIHTKRFFEVLYDGGLRAKLSSDQIAFIDKHVPFTRPLKRDERFEDYLEHKDAYIIKPVDYYASKGVCAGKDYTNEAWESLLEEKVNEDFIIQKYCPLALTKNLYEAADGDVEVKDYSTITGLFTYNEKLAGIYVRAGLNAIISGLHDGYTMSTLKVIKK
ncbi:MAG: hypothetical protein BGO41_10470 [Clostridiales bacterium 38-18]|nr:MAG: hypothetical protein BGO41_10470 [Clostridiales bacterium 38-18]